MARLSRLVGTDEGFFLLALHSFMESFICDIFPSYKYGGSFPTLLWDFKDFLKAKGRVTQEDLQAIIRISKEHPTANKVRHGFLPLGKEEAVAASFNFLGFCRACGISHPFLETLRQSLKIWDEKVSPLQKSQELAKLRFDLFVAQRENKKLLQQAADARDAEVRSEQLEADLKQRAAELARERARAGGKADRVDALRGELNSLNQQKKVLSEELLKFRDLDLYIEHLNRFTIYTRTRRDYERSLMRLTAEQQAALEVMTPGHDFLVRGGAGTGKTIVLLQAYSKARRDLFTPRTVLLTYTTTLVKYDRYLAELLRASEEPGLIQTADSFFLSRLRMIDPSWRVDYSAVDALARRWNTTGFMSDGELATEVEDFLFGNKVSKAEYVDDVVPRRGMRQPLSQAQRAQVWKIRQLIVGAMEDMGAFSKNYSRIKIIEAMGDNSTPSGSAGGASGSVEASGAGSVNLCDIDLAFVDESQDLTAVDLMALKLMCRRGVIMAGDAGQAIYGLGSPYKRAGIDITGRTKILRTDFRTTCPIHDLAEKYRELCAPDIEGEAIATHAFREGPPPELYRAVTREELLKLLMEKVSLFIDKLGYDPENITVLAPGKADVAAIQDRLSRRGITSANIRDDSFSFSAEGLVRVSTLHSSKGLDFPVVLLYLPSLPIVGDYDEKAANSLARNLIYVAMTRAMDNLNVFVMEDARERAVAELVGVLNGWN
jgi:predicted TIM-barrel fold metal-dependent hydrolase